VHRVGSLGGGTVSDDRYIAPRGTFGERLAYDARILDVLSRSEFKLKYAGSVLGYVWSLAKPLMYFTVLWIVFGSLFKPGIEHFALYLLIGIVLYTFFADAVTATLPSIVWSAPTLRRISFPPLVIPLASSLATAMTFLANCVAFLACSRIRPQVDWLLLVPLVLELYLFVLGLGLLAATLFVRFRDVGQIWEVASSLLFFSSPIMYPITILPHWAQRLVEFNPFVQVMQDVRTVLLGTDAATAGVTPRFDSRLFPIAIAVVLLAIGLLLHRRESPRFAERA
jgi:ABC-2 type transport system permease protein